MDNNTRIIDSITIEDIQQALHEVDIIQKPFRVICNPIDAEKLKKAGLEDMLVIDELDTVTVGNIYVMDRKKIENPFREWNLK